MANANKRTFKQGEEVYVIDWWGANAVVARAEILSVQKRTNTFMAVLYGDTYQKYCFDDYQKIIFDDWFSANNKLNTIPKEGYVVYQVKGKRVYKKIVDSICGRKKEKGMDVIIRFTKGDPVSIRQLGITIFASYKQAKDKVSQTKA